MNELEPGAFDYKAVRANIFLHRAEPFARSVRAVVRGMSYGPVLQGKESKAELRQKEIVMNKALVSLLLISTVFATPAFANYFSVNKMGSHLHIGSAPNPKPAPRIVAEPVRAEIPIVYSNDIVAEAPAPAPMAAPAPLPASIVAEAPPPPAVVRRFVVFFDFDKSNLSEEAKRVVGIAVMTARDNGMTRIVVAGHTDTVGTQRYNQALSERRAAATKAEMMRLGLDSRDIGTIGRSFSEPLVETGPGIREPQNRRVVIDLGYNITAADRQQ